MKKKLVLGIVILLLSIYSVSIFLIKSYFDNKCYCRENEEISLRIRQDFVDEYNPTENKYSYIIVGQYNNGYILISISIPIYFELKCVAKSIIIDEINIKYFQYTTFYYFEKGKVVEGLENIYNGGYISKFDLRNISEKFEEWKDYNYMIQKNYIVPYIFDKE